MDVATYWEDLKKKAKELTGVEKIKLGLLSNKSGVVDALEAFTAAKPNKKEAAALKAIKAIDKYMADVHDKELKAHKKEKVFTDAQLKSMTIVEKGLAKIKKSLTEVVQSGGGTGDMERNVADDATWFKYKDDVLAFVELRKKAAKEMTELKADFQERLKNIVTLGATAKGAFARLKQSKEQMKMTENLQELSILERAADEAQQIYEDANETASKQIRATNSTLMLARANCDEVGKIPQNKQDKYVPELTRLLDLGWKAGQENEALVQKMKQAAATVALVRDAGDNFSMQGINPEKYLPKLQQLDKDLKSIETMLSKCDSLKDKKAFQEDLETRIGTYTKGPEDFCKNQGQILTDQEGRITRGEAALKIITQKISVIPTDLREDPEIKKLAVDLVQRVRTLQAKLGTYTTRVKDGRDVVEGLRTATV